jgi:hypothetical protein
MRGAVFFSTCASIGDKGLSGRNRWCMFLLNFQAPVVWLGIKSQRTRPAPPLSFHQVSLHQVSANQIGWGVQ